MAIKTIRVFAEYTSDGYVPMPSEGNIDYGVTLGSTFPGTQPASFQTDDPNIDVSVTTMTDYYVWVRTHGSAWNPNYTRVVRIYPDSPSINSVVMNMIVAVGGGGTAVVGSSGVTYYLNGGTSQGTLDGSTYYEMSKSPVEVTGVDFFKIHTTGYENIAQFVTDANDPGLLKIPAGNWPLGFYMSASDNSGSPKFYGEIYKYSATGVFTILGSGVATPEVISNGMAIDYYTTNVSIPETTLLITDRIAIRIFVNTDGNRTVNLHTQDSHLSSIGTTFASGLTAINGLSKQVQFIVIGNAGSDVAIVSDNDTHTINLPTASSTKRGLLSSTDWSTFNNKQPYDEDLTAISNLADSSGLLRKIDSAPTWQIDTNEYLTLLAGDGRYESLSNKKNTIVANSTSQYYSVTAVNTGLASKLNVSGGTLTGNLNLESSVPSIILNDTASGGVYRFLVDGGQFYLKYGTTTPTTLITVNSTGGIIAESSITAASIIKSGGTASQFLKANGSIDSTSYQPLDSDLTAIAGLSSSSGLLRKVDAATWEIDQAEYMTITAGDARYESISNKKNSIVANSTTSYYSVTAVNNALATKMGIAGGTFTGDLIIESSFPALILNDSSSGTSFKLANDTGVFKLLYGTTTPVSITNGGAITASSFIKDGGTAAQFLKANGSVDSNTYATTSSLASYLTTANAATLYQSKSADLTAIDALALTTGLLRKNGTDTWELDQNTYLTSADLSNYQVVTNLSSNLTASTTKYPSVNAVNTGLALRLALAGGTMTGALTLGYSVPTLNLNDTDTGTIYRLINDGGTFKLNYLNTNIVSISTTGGITATSFIKSGGTSSQYLMADGSVTTGVTNAITGSGTATRIAFFDGTNTITSSSGLFWDNTAGRLAVGKNSADARLEVYAGTKGQIRANGGTAMGGGLDIYTELSGTGRRNWGIYTEVQTPGDMSFLVSASAGTAPIYEVLTMQATGIGSYKYDFNVVGKLGASDDKGLYLRNTSDVTHRLYYSTTRIGMILEINNTFSIDHYNSGSPNTVFQFSTGGNFSNAGTIQSGGNVGIKVAPSSTFALITANQGITGSNTYFGSGLVRVGGPSDHGANTVFSVAPGVVEFDRPGVGGGALKIFSDGNIGINQTTNGGRKLEIQTNSTSAALWVQTGGTTSGYTIADFRTGTNASALQLLGNANAIFGGSVVATGFETTSANNGKFGINDNGSDGTQYRFYQFSTSGTTYVINTQMGASGEYDIWQYSGTWRRNFRMTGLGAATFTSSVQASSFTDGYITWSAAQINRTGSLVELQYGAPGGIRFFGNTSYPITFTSGTGVAGFTSEVNIGSQLSVSNGAINFGGAGSSASTDPAIYRVGSGINDLIIATNSSERIRITNAGNIGMNGNPANYAKLNIFDTGVVITNGNAIAGTNMKGILLENTNNGDESIGLWFRTGSNHLSGISGQRDDNTAGWGTDLRFYTHERATQDLPYAKERMRLTTEGYLLIGTRSISGYRLEVSGSVLASAFYESSDLKLKNITKSYKSNDFGAIEFNWKDNRDSKNHWGYIAQEVQKYIPDAVNLGNDGYLSVDYNQAHTFKIAKVEDEVTKLKNRVKELEKQLNVA